MTIWIILLIIFFIVVYIIWEILRPIHFSKPGGSYSVGTFGIEITDTSRIENASKESKYRRLILQFWYPALEKPGLKKAKYHPNADQFNSDVASLFKSIPQLFLKRLSGSTTNSLANAPLSESETNQEV